MKLIDLIRTGVLFFMVGIVAPTYANQERGPEAKSPKQEEQKKHEPQGKDQQEQKTAPSKAKAQPQQKQQPQRKDQQEQQKHQSQAKAQHPQQKQQAQGKDQQEQQKRQSQAKAQQPQQKEQPQTRIQREQKQANPPSPEVHHARAVEQRSAWQDHRARNWQSEHRTWQQRGGYKGYRIPQARYTAYFGPAHPFRVYSYTVVIVGGYPRFQYGGFWFIIVDPWPEYWSDDWYENDDVYVDYFGDGYYLCNRRHPQERIAITVSLN